MKGKKLSEAIAPVRSSIKEVMRVIDHSGLRVAYIVDTKKRLVGAVSDSEIRRAILKGVDISEPAKSIVNPSPIVLRQKDLGNHYAAMKTVRQLLSKMPDSRYILLVNNKNMPKKLILCSGLLGEEKLRARSTGRRVLIVGGAGYLGSVLSRRLIEKGFKVRVLDLLMYGIEPIAKLMDNKNFEFIEGDMRNISTIALSLADVDSVINLAAVVGDPACTNKPEDAIETNYLANKSLAEACKYHQINRFIYASTCSVYGAMDGDKPLDENSPLNPVSLYARSKIQSEEGILSLADENFSPTILRMGTLYGYSMRMRFDLVLNTMTKTAVIDKKISVHGGGRQWRPLLHVEDAAEAYLKCLEAPIKKIKCEIFNVGSEKQNYQILQIARIIQKCVPGARLIIEGKAGDPRNYLVSFSKIEKTLGFKACKKVREGILRIKKAIETKEITYTDNPKYYNVEYNK